MATPVGRGCEQQVFPVGRWHALLEGVRVFFKRCTWITTRSAARAWRSSIASTGDLLVQQYKKHLSDYSSWEPLSHADQWLIFPGNLGPRLSIDESSLSRGELYTIVTNKDGHGGKGTLVAIIEGVKAVEVSRI